MKSKTSVGRFDALCSVVTRLYAHMDASETVTFARALWSVDKRIFAIKYEDMKGRDLVPTASGVDSAATHYAYHEFDQYAIAELMADYSQPGPKASVSGKEYFVKTYPILLSYDYDINEVDKASKGGYDLPTGKAEACSMGIEHRIDQVIQVGYAPFGLFGLFNQPTTNLYVVPNGVSGFADWKRKTPKEILTDLNGICNAAYNVTKGLERSDNLVLPQAAMEIIQTTVMGDGNSEFIIDVFKRSRTEELGRDFTITSWSAGIGQGVGGTNRVVAYKKDPLAIELIMPTEKSTLPPQVSGFVTTVHMHAKTAGVVLRRPLSMTYADGIVL